MKIFLFILTTIALILGLLLIKPMPKDKVSIVLGDKSGKKNAITIGSKNSKLKIDKPLMQIKIKKGGKLSKPTKISKDELNKNFGNVIKAIPQKVFSTNIFFIKEDHPAYYHKIKLFQIRNEIKRRKPCEVDIIGYSDSKGTKEENLRISQKRAKYIENLIRDMQLGIEKINTTALGESNQLIKTADEVSEPKNRRVEIIIK